MPIRTAITKVSGQGEQIVIDVCQWNPVTGAIAHGSVDEMAELMDNMLKFADVRLEEMNTRSLEAYQLIEMLHESQRQMLYEIMDVLCGRTTAAMVRHRWESIREENAELQAQREAAHAALQGQLMNGNGSEG